MVKYLLNGFLLLIPVFIWNIVFISSLPESFSNEVFGNEIPKVVGITENILRVIVFVLPLFMAISFSTKIQKAGLWIYIVGIAIYFLSWVMQIYFPETFWSKSVFGFTAPAFTTIIWFIGIGLIGQNTFIKIPYFSTVYFSMISLFVIFHTLHTYIVYSRL